MHARAFAVSSSGIAVCAADDAKVLSPKQLAATASGELPVNVDLITLQVCAPAGRRVCLVASCSCRWPFVLFRLRSLPTPRLLCCARAYGWQVPPGFAKGQALIRLAHQFAANEDASLSKAANVSLAALFPSFTVRERTW